MGLQEKPDSPKLSDLPNQKVVISNLNKNHSDEVAKTPQPKNVKREKIFVDVYSSYLHINKSGSPEERRNQRVQVMSEHEASAEERELTPMARGVPMDNNEMRDGSYEGVKKQGASQIIKYLDLSRFKIEKCKNLTNGRQHNHKHCRYFHTDKDQRRVLDYSGYGQLVNGTFEIDSKFSNPIVQIDDKLYTPDLCENSQF